MKVEYTLDKLVMDIRIDMASVKQFLQKIGSPHGYGAVVKLKNWQSGKIQGFRENLTIELDDGNSFYVGITANWEIRSDYATTVRMEFNPAKVRGHVVFQAIQHDFVAPAKYIDFKRFDVAVDIPIERENVWMKKDKRQERTIKNSNSDFTQYLGNRSSHGAVKMYNKQKESKLKSPMTRLELTLEYDNSSYEEFKRLWPKVTYVDSGQMEMDEITMDGTERVLLLSCMEHPEYIEMLGRKMRKKIECILERYTHGLEADMKNYGMILSDIRTFGRSIYYGGLENYLIIKGIGWN